ncbi:MAG: 6-bladed beta-propeller [Nitritalea sp.]
MNKPYFVIVFLLLFVRCHQREETDNLLILKVEETRTFLDAFRVVGFTELGEESGMGGVNRLEVGKEHLYVLDEESSQALHVYTLGGLYSHSVRSFERGRIYDFVVDEEAGYLYAFTPGRRIEQFLLDGSFVRSTRLPFGFEKLLFAAGETLWLYTGYDTERDHLLVQVATATGEVLQERLPKPEEPPLDFMPQQFSGRLSDGGFFIYPPLGKVLHTLTAEGELAQTMTFDFEGRLASDLDELALANPPEDLITHADGFLLLGDKLLFHFSEAGVPAYRLLDLKHLSFQELRPKDKSVDDFILSFACLQPMASKGNTFYSVLDVDYIRLFLSESAGSQFEELKDSDALFVLLEMELK